MTIIEELILSDVSAMPCRYFDKDALPCAREHATMAVFDDMYELISCKYIPLGKDRFSCIKSLKKAAVSFQYLNPDVTEKDLRVWLRSKVENSIVETPLEPMDVNRISREKFGVDVKKEVTVQTKRTMWLKRWTNEKIDNAFKIYGNKSPMFIEILADERRKFAVSCYNKTEAKKSQDKFLDAIDYIREKYGFISAEMVAEYLDISEDHFYVLKSRIEKMMNEDFEVINAKALTSRNSISKSGDLVHYEDKKIITKSRIHRKSTEKGHPVSRPTIDSHWHIFEPHFNYLNEMLNTEQQ